MPNKEWKKKKLLREGFKLIYHGKIIYAYKDRLSYHGTMNQLFKQLFNY